MTGVVQTVLFPEDLATVTKTVNTFWKITYLVSDHSNVDFWCALDKLELGWGSCTSDLDHLFCLPARFVVKNNLPLTVPNVEDKIVRGEGRFEAVQAHVAKFWTTWGNSCPYHYAISHLPPNTHFATTKEVEEHHINNTSTTEAAKMYSDTVSFTVQLACDLYKNNFTSRPLVEVKADIVVVTNSLQCFFHPDSTASIGDTVAEAIKTFIQQDSTRLFQLANTETLVWYDWNCKVRWGKGRTYELDSEVPMIIVGNFNLHSLSWSLRGWSPSPKVPQLKLWATAQALELVTVPREITRKGMDVECGSTLDLVWHNCAMTALLSLSPPITDWEASLGSDHVGICMVWLLDEFFHGLKQAE
ncbi:hypothetical protein BJY52DRAFT_1231127 [Lactarius psammicola]|nr:hypothetical protein BJY52DRAFT_1231127 [Lactarius psammicola]